jgi:hypothetical protein
MPRYQRVPLDKIVVDPRYQREIIPGHVNTIRKEFDEAQLDVLHLSKRSEDEYACMDGQHRLIVLNERDDQDTAPALVHEHLTPEEEAALFRGMQEGRRQLMPLDKFKSRVFEGDDIARGVVALADKHRLEIGTGPKSIQSIVAFERVYRRGNLPATLDMLETWRGDPKWLEGALCDGVSRFLDLYPEADHGHARAKWSEVSPTQILRNASDLVSSSKAGGVLEFLRSTYSTKKMPLPPVAKAQEERKAVQSEHGRRYRRVTLSEVRDAAVEMERFTVHQMIEKLGVSRPALVKKGGLLEQLMNMGILIRKREASEGQGGGGAYWYEYVPPDKQKRSTQRPSRGRDETARSNGGAPVPHTGRPEQRTGGQNLRQRQKAARGKKIVQK